MRVAIACVFLFACANNVRQNKATSKDGTIKGATPIALENGAAEERGIVTYPGGDRVDWKKVELPENRRGDLALKLTWATPRPGLKLSFDVFDAWNGQVITGKRAKAPVPTRAATIRDARGTYFIRVFAVGRGDAGRYKLDVDFEAKEIPKLSEVEVALPPRLADVPDLSQAPQKCDLVKFDYSSSDCADKCPLVNPQQTWPGCSKTCTVMPPDASIPACAAKMACPRGGDLRVASCTEKDYVPCPDPKNPDLTNLRCINHKYLPETARIVGKAVIGGEVEVIILIGKSNIDKTWTATLLQGTSPKPLAGGKLTIVRVDGGTLIGRTRLTAQQVQDNLTVLFVPPPKQK